MFPIITLKPGKDIPLLAGHPWVWSEAISSSPKGLGNGDIVEVQAANRKTIGLGSFNPNTSIRVRILTRDAGELIDAAYFTKRFRSLDIWKRERLPEDTDGYRVVHAEADGIPGLILDRFDETFVFQIHTAGMERFREHILKAVEEVFHPSTIVERSDVDARLIEGLKDQPVTIHKGAVEKPVTFEEAGLRFYADVLHGQKTGFFLDQRNARLKVGELANDKRVLNLFGYTGAFSIHATNGGASFVNTVDISRKALELAQENFRLNGFDPEDEEQCQFLEADVLELLQSKELPDGPYDLIICDPPAFAKNERHLSQALRAYTDLNVACLKQLSPGGILVTSSCSGRLDPEEFRAMLRIAAGRAGKTVRVLDWLTQPVDHAELLAFPEGRYLKTAVLEVIG